MLGNVDVSLFDDALPERGIQINGADELEFAPEAYVENVQSMFTPDVLRRFDVRNEGGLRVGDVAPDVSVLQLASGSDHVAPVTLSHFPRLVYVPVYIEEAHPCDGWRIYSHVQYDAPTSTEARVALAREFFALANAALAKYDGRDPLALLAVDDVSNAAGTAFSAWPERLYLLDADLRVLYKGALGPDGYKPAEVEAYLTAHHL